MMKPSISIITVTFNAAHVLAGLIDSLRAQTDQDFEWVVVDGASTDGTLEMMKSAGDIAGKCVSEPDCGIYDAMNKAVSIADGEYYLVCGADDRLSADAIENYRKHWAWQPDCDLVVAGVRAGSGLRMGYRPQKRWLGHVAMFTHHSVGTLIRRDLHKIHGNYDLRFALLADGLFLKSVAIDPNAKIIAADFIAGEYASGGASETFLARSLFELWVIQLLTEPRPFLQTCIFISLVIKNFGRIAADIHRFREKKFGKAG